MFCWKGGWFDWVWWILTRILGIGRIFSWWRGEEGYLVERVAIL
ncbi:MAG TPA: hypothetical protein VLL52_20060 [Anaerolineae bacterium]|nr:hypothetical protein [Anaerolineae bacterium]